jgi:ribosomal protein S2
MDLLAAIKREERKIEKELSKLQNKLRGVRDAAKMGPLSHISDPSCLLLP